jgi:adenine-specific DNA-methyltransferase
VKAYPAILSVDKKAPTVNSIFRAVAIPKLPPPSLESMVIEHVRPVRQATLGDDVWSLADAPDKEILSKLKTAGTSLGEYVKGKVYYGIKTGLNLAFVIDAETRNRLIAKHAGSADIIKPFLAGRDAKRYRQPIATTYLILLPSGWTRQKLGWQRNQRGTYAIPPTTPNFATPWDALLAHYPAVAEYLLPFEKAAAARTDKGNYWWELRACDYYNEFEKPKIIIPTFATRAPYTYDNEGLYSNDKTTIIPTDDLFLLGVLNSNTTDFYFKSIGAKLKDAFFEYKPKYLSQLPIPAATPDEQAAIAALVTQILAAKAADPAVDTRVAEAAVDARVAALYGVALPAAAS